MKYFIFLFLLFSFEVFSQHMLILNTGEKLHGKLIEVRNGKIKFQFQNNLMMFKGKRCSINCFGYTIIITSFKR